MEFRITKDVFLKALQKVQGIVERRNTMPILSNVLIEASGENIHITATDLEVGMQSSYPAEVFAEGRITVGAKKLYEIVKELSQDSVRVKTRENDWVEIMSGKAVFNIVGLPPEEFPYFPKVSDGSFLRLPGATVRDMIEKISYAICNDETKYNLNGVFIKAGIEKGSNVLRMVATDGHRLSITEKGFEGAIGGELERGVIFPKKGIFELKKAADEEDGDLSLGFMDNNAVIKKEHTIIVMRLVDGEFPDYTKVVPQNNDRVVTVGREQLLHSLRRMSILSSEKFKGIKFEINPTSMEISSSNPELGEAKEDVEIEYQGDTLVSRFNARYLIDVLSVLGESTVEILFRNELSPAILRPAGDESFTSVIMPMRL